jgi:hypothetical protein
MAFIREKIAEFSPGLAEECARLGTKRLDLGADAP